MDRIRKKKKRRHTLNDPKEASLQIQIAAAVAATATTPSQNASNKRESSPSGSEPQQVKASVKRSISSNSSKCIYLRYGSALRRCPMPSPITTATIKSLFVNMFDLSPLVLDDNSSWQVFILDKSNTWTPMENISMVHSHCTLLLVNPAELASSSSAPPTSPPSNNPALTSASAPSLAPTSTTTNQPKLSKSDSKNQQLKNNGLWNQHNGSSSAVSSTPTAGQQLHSNSEGGGGNGEINTRREEGGGGNGETDTRREEGGGDSGEIDTRREEGGGHNGEIDTRREEGGSGNGEIDTRREEGGDHNGEMDTRREEDVSETSTDTSSRNSEPRVDNRLTSQREQHLVQQPQRQLQSYSSSSVSDSKSNTSVDFLASAHTLQRSIQQLKGAMAAVRNEHLLRAAEFRYDMAIARGSIRGAIASFVRHQGAKCSNKLSFRHKRLELDPQKEAYIHSSQEVFKDLNVLQLLIEEMRIDAVERRCRVKNEEVESLAPAVKVTLTNIARLRARYPSLERSLREVMVKELQVIVHEEKFTENEMPRLERALESCKTLAQTMQTLLQFSSMQDKRPVRVPVVVVTSQPKEKKALVSTLMESVGAICPNHDMRLKALDYAELVRKRKKQMNNFKKEIWWFESQLQEKRKQLRPVNSLKGIDRQRSMKLKKWYMEDKVTQDVEQDRIGQLMEEKRRHMAQVRESTHKPAEQKSKETDSAKSKPLQSESSIEDGQARRDMDSQVKRKSDNKSPLPVHQSSSPKQLDRSKKETKEEEFQRRKMERRLERERRYQQIDEEVRRERNQMKQQQGEHGRVDNKREQHAVSHRGSKIMEQLARDQDDQPQASKPAGGMNIMDVVLGKRLEREDEMRREKEQFKEQEHRKKEEKQEQRADSHRGSKIMQQLAHDQDDTPQASKPAVGKQNIMDMVLGKRLEREDKMRREKEQLKEREHRKMEEKQEQRADSHRGSKIMQQLARDQEDTSQTIKPAVGKQNIMDMVLGKRLEREDEMKKEKEQLKQEDHRRKQEQRVESHCGSKIMQQLARDQEETPQASKPAVGKQNIMDMVLGRRLEHEDEMRREKEQLKQEEQKRIKDSQEQRTDSHCGSKIMQQLARDQDDQPQASKPRPAVGKQNIMDVVLGRRLEEEDQTMREKEQFKQQEERKVKDRRADGGSKIMQQLLTEHEDQPQASKPAGQRSTNIMDVVLGRRLEREDEMRREKELQLTQQQQRNRQQKQHVHTDDEQQGIRRHDLVGSHQQEEQIQAKPAGGNQSSTNGKDWLLERRLQLEEEIRREKEKLKQGYSSGVVKKDSMKEKEKQEHKVVQRKAPDDKEKTSPAVDRILERKREREQRWLQAEEEIRREKDMLRNGASIVKKDSFSNKERESEHVDRKKPSSEQRKPFPASKEDAVDRLRHEREQRRWQAEEKSRREQEQLKQHRQQYLQQKKGHSVGGGRMETTEQKPTELLRSMGVTMQTNNSPVFRERQIQADKQRDPEPRRAVETGQQILSRMEKRKERKYDPEDLERQKLEAEEELRLINEERKRVVQADKEKRRTNDIIFLEEQQLALEEEQRKIRMEKYQIQEQQRKAAERRREEQGRWQRETMQQVQWGLLDDTAGNQVAVEQRREQLWQQIQQQVHQELEEERSWKHQQQRGYRMKREYDTLHRMPRPWRAPEPYPVHDPHSHDKRKKKGYIHNTNPYGEPPSMLDLPPYEVTPRGSQLSPVYRTTSMRDFSSLQRSNSEESLYRLKLTYDQQISKPPTVLVSPKKALPNKKPSPNVHSGRHHATNQRQSLLDPQPMFHHSYTAQPGPLKKSKGGGSPSKPPTFDSSSLPRSQKHHVHVTEFEDQRDKHSTSNSSAHSSSSMTRPPPSSPNKADAGFNWHTPTNRTSYPRSPEAPPSPSYNHLSAANTPTLKHRHEPTRITNYPHYASAILLASPTKGPPPQEDLDPQSQSISYV